MRGSSMVRWTVAYQSRVVRVGTCKLYSLFATRAEAEESFKHAVDSSKYKAVKVKLTLRETTDKVEI